MAEGTGVKFWGKFPIGGTNRMGESKPIYTGDCRGVHVQAGPLTLRFDRGTRPFLIILHATKTLVTCYKDFTMILTWDMAIS